MYDLDNVTDDYDPSLTVQSVGFRTTTAINLHGDELVDDGSALELELYDPDDGADEAALDLINRIEANGQRNPLAPKGLQGADTLGLRMVENAHLLTKRGPGTKEERLDNLKEKFGLDKMQVRYLVDRARTYLWRVSRCRVRYLVDRVYGGIDEDRSSYSHAHTLITCTQSHHVPVHLQEGTATVNIDDSWEDETGLVRSKGKYQHMRAPSCPLTPHASPPHPTSPHPRPSEEICEQGPAPRHHYPASEGRRAGRAHAAAPAAVQPKRPASRALTCHRDVQGGIRRVPHQLY